MLGANFWKSACCAETGLPFWQRRPGVKIRSTPSVSATAAFSTTSHPEYALAYVSVADAPVSAPFFFGAPGSFCWTSKMRFAFGKKFRPITGPTGRAGLEEGAETGLDGACATPTGAPNPHANTVLRIR